MWNAAGCGAPRAGRATVAAAAAATASPVTPASNCLLQQRPIAYWYLRAPQQRQQVGKVLIICNGDFRHLERETIYSIKTDTYKTQAKSTR
jgi:hypothetical protein